MGHSPTADHTSGLEHSPVIMPSVPVSLLLVLLAAQTSTAAAGEPRRLLSSLPSLLSLPFPATLQLLRLERIRELKQSILEREETQNLEEMINSVEMEKTEEAKISPVPMVTKRNPICLRRCLRAGILHPAQCYALC